jgi:pimeloyl-ACP methyl ester carboxylesterase
VVLKNSFFDTGFINQAMQANVKLMQDGWEYAVDTWQRTFLFQDVLRKRGNDFIEHRKQGSPPVLTFKYKIISDGRTFDRPANYALARVFPKSGKPHDPTARPVVIIDPRAGHGPGIGGFKEESEIGIALGNGHPVYFIMFFSNPVAGQTLDDVLNAKIRFLEIIRQEHPDTEKPAVIGNCQAGWATALIAAMRPDLTGPIMLNGAPLSYWSGNRLNTPLRFKGGFSGGNWLSSFLSDLGNGRFDGAYVVSGFEDLNPANTLWKKPYHLYAHVDTEEERYLGFERWWGGFFFLTKKEMQFITESLFVGNRPERDRLEVNGRRIDLRQIDDPVVVFSSHGDNITSPQQALGWIAETWKSEDNIKQQGKVIIYLIHQDIGHLGIFVSGSVARKEHKELLEHMELFDKLSPGLYEMVISDKKGKKGTSRIQFQPRTIQDITRLNDDWGSGAFQVMNDVSQVNDRIYNHLISPFITAATSEYSAAVVRKMHPLRMERYVWSDLNPAMIPVKTMAAVIREDRKPADGSNLFSVMERSLSDGISILLDYYRDQRDLATAAFFYGFYGNPLGLAWHDILKPLISGQEEIISNNTSKE